MNVLKTNPAGLLALSICLAILAVGWSGLCCAEERPVIENSIGMKLVSIPAGEFMMGGTPEEVDGALRTWRPRVEQAKGTPDEAKVQWAANFLPNWESEKPQHRVAISKPFFLGKFEVTQKDYATVMGFNPSRFAATGSLKNLVAGIDTTCFPVDGVSWHEAVAFCQQLSALPEEQAAGRTYRLPTEAEWEYACRAGTKTAYYWGDKTGEQGSLVTECAWFARDSANRPHPVGEKRPNAWGLYDMIGNIAEWCADWYGPEYYAVSPAQDPAGPSSGTTRVLRGGPFNSGDAMARSGFRAYSSPNLARSRFFGFRVACEVSTPAVPVVESTPPPSTSKELEARLKEKGLSRRMGYFLLPEEAQFIRFATTIERLRAASFHSQREYQDAEGQLSRIQAAQAGAVKARMQARTAMSYSDRWRDNWHAVRARNQASDALLLAQLSKEDIQRWRKDAQADLDNALSLYGQQIEKLKQMHQKLRADYARLGEDGDVKHALAEMNNLGKGTYRLGPTPSAALAAKKLEKEQATYSQLKGK